jgi:hypothetical protein
MSFLVPSALQDSAPSPTDASVYLEVRKGFRVVAKRFPGFAGDKDFNTQAAELFSLATDAGLQVYRSRIHERTNIFEVFRHNNESSQTCGFCKDFLNHLGEGGVVFYQVFLLSPLQLYSNAMKKLR